MSAVSAVSSVSAVSAVPSVPAVSAVSNVLDIWNSTFCFLTQFRSNVIQSTIKSVHSAIYEAFSNS